MTPALAILERSFRSIEVPRLPPRDQRSVAGVYLLVGADLIVYVGASRDVAARLYQHATGEFAETFDRALHYPLPAKVHPHYEGAFIRALCPRHNRIAPKHHGYDNEILTGFDLPPHDDEHAVAHSWQTSRPAATPRDPGAFGRLLRSWLEQRRITVSGLARAINTSRQAVHCWLSGATAPTLDRIETIAAALGVSVAELYHGATSTPPGVA